MASSETAFYLLSIKQLQAAMATLKMVELKTSFSSLWII
jgi:hypothetical protein